MLQTSVQSSVTPRFSGHPFDASRPQVTLSLNQRRSTLNLFIPSSLHDGKGIWIASGVAARAGVRDGAVFSVIQAMIAWIEDHLDQPLSVDAIAGRSGYSVWHFQRKFAQFTGLNVYEYVRIRRIIAATFSLTTTDKGILEIAVENGFNCQASFTRTVRLLTGYTPGKIRRQFSHHPQQWIEMIKTVIAPQPLDIAR